MAWLNYNHLYYFWMIVQEGSLSKAAARLHVTHSTLSAQLKLLEEALDSTLFERKGKRLILTPLGAETAEYAADIFRLGDELIERSQRREVSRHPIVKVGVVGSVPKTITYHLLKPLYQTDSPCIVHLRQDAFEALLPLLVTNRIMLILSDQPAPQGTSFRLHSHLLGETEILLYGEQALAARYRDGFPASLHNAPMLFPGAGSSLYRVMERWFVDRGLRVKIAGEIDDSGHMRVFGAYGVGLFPVRSVLSREVEETHHVHFVGALNGVSEKYYMISRERKLKNPILTTLLGASRKWLEGVS